MGAKGLDAICAGRKKQREDIRNYGNLLQRRVLPVIKGDQRVGTKKKEGLVRLVADLLYDQTDSAAR